MTQHAPFYSPFPSFSAWHKHEIELGYWHQTVASLRAERDTVASDAQQAAAEVVTRAAAVDTNAIEGLYEADRGFTITVATYAAGWQSAFEQRGEQARSMFEAQLRASELVLDAATKSLPVTEALIRSLHEHACAAQKTHRVWTALGWQEHDLEKGTYKLLPNNPRRLGGEEHAYAPVAEVASEMARLVQELNGEPFLASDAPYQAAFAHYAFVSVHPFADGNGRVARALASIYLTRATSVPLLVYNDQKPRYLDALAAADDGEYRAFTQFIRDRSLDAMGLLLQELQRAKLLPIEELRDKASRLHFATPEFTHIQVDALADRLLHDTMSEIESTFRKLGFPEGITLSTKIAKGESIGPPTGYRKLGRREAPVLAVLVKSAPPAVADISANIRPLVARSDHPQPVRLEERHRRLAFDAALSDLAPELTSVLRARLHSWVEMLLRHMVQEAIERGNASLEKSGWNG